MFPILQFMVWFDEVEAQVQASQENCYRLGLASFPSHSHPQYIQRGKPWEIWSCVVTSGRQMIDTHGAVPSSNNFCLVSNHPWRYE